MRLARIHVSNVLGLRALDVTIEQPVLLIAGSNGAGKSSLRDCLGLALLGETCRGVVHNKDRGALVAEGAKSGRIEFVDSDGDIITVEIDQAGKVKDSAAGREHDPALPLVLDPARFARLPVDERRTFLFNLMRVDQSEQAIKDRLLARGCAPDKIAVISPLLRLGFPGACKAAKERATEAKGAWRAITGEAYGSTKAPAWKAVKPDVDLTALAAARQQAADLDQQIEALNRSIGTREAEVRAAQERNARINGLRQQAGMVARIRDKLERDEVSLREWEKIVATTQAKAEGSPGPKPITYPCPCCGEELEFRQIAGETGLVKYEPAPQQYEDPEAQVQLPAHLKARDLLRRSVENDKRDLAAAEAAAAQLQALEKEQAAAAASPDAEPLETLRQRLEQAKTQRTAAREAVATGEEQQRRADEADAKTTKALEAHHAVEAWSRIGDALSPDGIPAELLAGALKPINDRLAQSAADTGWPPVTIDAEMSIRYGSRPLNLCSESERWRADAMLGEAIATLSGLRLLVLDRADVLDLPGRAALFGWLGVLAETGEIDTAIVAATLKALPGQMPAGVQGVWLESGRVKQAMKEAA